MASGSSGLHLFRSISPVQSRNISMSPEEEHHDHRVRNRLHALFSHASQPEAGPSRPKLSMPTVRRKTITRHDVDQLADSDGAAYASLGGELRKCSTEPVIRLPEAKDRDAIKVFVCTWNMGDALPKGDLSVLLGGPVPPYEPPDRNDPEAFGTAGLPRLSVNNAHPYHIVVVAGQECPTDSGVPRGLGGGIMKGMSVRGGRKEREQKEKETKEARDAGKPVKGEDKLLPSGLERLDLDVLDEDADRARGSSPLPTTPGPHSPALHHRHKGGNAGWSGLLDEWFCGITAQSKHHVLGNGSPSSRDAPTVPSPQPLIRSVSASVLEGIDVSNEPFSASLDDVRALHPPDTPSPAPARAHLYADHLGVPSLSHAHQRASSPLAKDTTESGSSSSSRSSSSSMTPVAAPPPVERLPVPVPPPKSASIPVSAKLAGDPRQDRPGIIIPDLENGKIPMGSGSYLHLAKERLMGMYLSVYVYKGCEHLVEGVDKDYVTAGLAGGRLGNKGGIGISLKLAGHSFLFVNSHLTAHTGRNAARLANIAKIKADLRLDAFLPHDDPRNSAEDITEKFDTIFWCGDLNFRLDMSRLHAEWLVEQKKYQEALTWDQLKLVMADPNLNPFPGFEEGPIDFPPTFKYDVWRSIKATNRDLRKSIKRRGSDAKSIREGKEAVVGSARSTGPLSHLAEEITEDDLESEEENGTNPPSSYRRSLESNRTRGGPPSLAGTDGDELSEGSPNPGLSQSALNSAYNSHRPLDIAIKEKTKKFFNVVKLGVSGQSSSSLARRISLRRSSARKQEDVDAPLAPPHPVYHDADLASRRTSLSSAISITDEASSREDAQRVPPLLIPGAAHGAPDRGMLAASPMSIEGDSRLRAESVTSSAPFSSSPPNGQPRKFGLKRTVSGKSFKGSTSIDDDDARGSIDMEEDTREGVYDTSKKQRVPSWCDRVLWKAHIVPDPEDTPSEPMHRGDSRKPLDRLSAAITNWGGHLRSSMARTSTLEPGTDTRRHSFFRDHKAPSDSVSNAPTLVASPIASPTEMHEADTIHALGPPVTPRKMSSPSRNSSFSNRPQRANSPSLASPVRQDSDPLMTRRHPLLKHRSSGSGGQSPSRAATSGSTAKPKITFDEASSPTRDRKPGHFSRPRANSDIHDHASLGDILKPNMNRSPSFPPRVAISKVKSADQASRDAAGSPSHKARLSDGVIPSRTRTISVTPSDQHQSKYLLDGGRAVPMEQSHESASNDRSTLTRFLDSLPAWLHRGTVTPHQPEQDQKVPETPQPVPKRHQHGEVVCLHYGTIDDAGMRLLEGRSDHRPAIFSAAVYI